MEEENLEYLNATFPCRRHQIQQLYEFLGEADEPTLDSLFIHGGPATGKSTITAALLQRFAIQHVIINMVECYTTKILYETILNKFAGHKVDPGNGLPYARCDNMMDFVDTLRKIAETKKLDGSVLVLDGAEELRNMDANLLAAFLRLKELTGIEICVVFISELIFEKYYCKSNVTEPIKVYFPQYNKEELLEIMSKDYEHALNLIANNTTKPFMFDLQFYQNYLNVFLSVFYRACRDFSELRHMSRVNFPKYCQPIIDGVHRVDDSMALWRNVAPILKSSLEVLYLRISSDSCSARKPGTDRIAQSLELPYYAKYLLIASYLASYNPAKDDKRIFMKYHGKTKKTMKDVKKKSKVSEMYNTQLGPKLFSFDRLLAIFYSILDNKVGFNNNLLVQVSSLVELQLLTTASDSCSLDGQKYKCNVNFDFVNTLSKMLGFNIRKYLSDFSHM